MRGGIVAIAAPTIVLLFTGWRIRIAIPIASWRREILPRRVRQRLRVLGYVGIGIHPLRVAFFRVRREEDASHRIIVPRDIIVKPGERVAVLAGVTSGRSHRAVGAVQQVAVETIFYLLCFFLKGDER